MVAVDSKEENLLEKKMDQCALEKNKRKKKKKSSSGSGALTPVASFYKKALHPYPVNLNNTKAKGRHAVAATKLDAGVVVCQEQASAFVVRSEYLDQQCHVCLSDLKQKLMCSDCRMTYYCSEECLKKDNDLHVLVCAPFAQVEAIGRVTDVEPDMLRLMTLLLARKHIDQMAEESQQLAPTPYWCVEDLLSHKENADPAFVRVINEACMCDNYTKKKFFFELKLYHIAQRLLMEMPEKIQSPVDEMVTLACR
jgi:SET and MYND domain-containing protein